MFIDNGPHTPVTAIAVPLLLYADYRDQRYNGAGRSAATIYYPGLNGRNIRAVDRWRLVNLAPTIRVSWRYTMIYTFRRLRGIK